MNVVEARETSFIIDAKNENDLHDGLGEFNLTDFEKNCDWTTTEYEPPEIHKVEELKRKKIKPLTNTVKNQRLQKKFNKIIDSFNKMEVDNE